MADWEEIKRLAADFQRTQASDTLQRISERNCIDIIKKLTDLNLIELIYTCDGREFITPAHLTREIEDEIYINGGRVHLHDLSANLNVDYQHIENRCKELVKEKTDEYNLILGQIIHSTYKNTLGKQIYETMITTGQLSISDFAKALDLPSEFLLTIVKEILPKIMDDFVVSPDERTYYTTDMMDRYKSIIAGTLSAITRPTTIASIMKKNDISERLFNPIVDGLIKEGRIDATIENRLFIPSIYAREQNEWIEEFYSANSYIEYDVLSRKDIKQPKIFLKKKFPDGIQLKTCFVSPSLISQVESLIEDCVATNSLVDISAFLPPSIQPSDIDQILQDIFKCNKQFSSSTMVFDRTCLCSLGYIATSKSLFVNLMDVKAREHLEKGTLINYFLGGKVKKPETTAQKVYDEGSKIQSNKVDEQSGDNNEPKESEKREQEKNDGLCSHTGQELNTPERDIELFAEDIKRAKRNKKTRVEFNEVDSDDEQSSSKKKSRKKVGGGSGGGSQGREIKQKSVKKKYLPGNKGKNKGDRSDDDAEDDVPTSKTSRSQRGRTARRAESPEGQSQSQRSKEKPTEREALIFMDIKGIANQLKINSRDLGDLPDELFDHVAATLEHDLNKTYESRARETLDEYLKRQAEQEGDVSTKKETIDLVE